MIKETRPSHKDSLFLSVGDEFQGTMFFSYYEGGWKVSEAMNMMGFDAMTLGNHEFDKGSQHLGEFINNLTFPVVSANVFSTNPILNETVKPFQYFPQYDLALIGSVNLVSSPGDEVLGVVSVVTPITARSYWGKYWNGLTVSLSIGLVEKTLALTTGKVRLLMNSPKC